MEEAILSTILSEGISKCVTLLFMGLFFDYYLGFQDLACRGHGGAAKLISIYNPEPHYS